MGLGASWGAHTLLAGQDLSNLVKLFADVYTVCMHVVGKVCVCVREKKKKVLVWRWT